MNGLEPLFHQLVQTQSWQLVVLAFLGGIVSSLLPCTIAMLPILVGYIGGYAGKTKTAVFQQAFFFILGSAAIMTALGIVFSILGLTFGAWIKDWFYPVLGLVILLMGAQLAGWITLPMPSFINRLPETSNAATPLQKIWAPFLLGLAFGASSSPCGTPFLTAILGLISYQKNVLLGGTALFAYAMGQGMLLLAAGLFTGLLKHLARLRQVGSVFNTLSAWVFILMGLLLLAMPFIPSQWLTGGW